jgi:hypothetical protein
MFFDLRGENVMPRILRSTNYVTKIRIRLHNVDIHNSYSSADIVLML